MYDKLFVNLLYHVPCMLNHVRSWLYVGDDSRSFVILDGLPDIYGLKCDGLTASVVAIVLVLL